MSNYLCANGSHFIPSWTDVIEHGFVKYYEKAKALRADLDPNDPESVDKRIFYNGIIEVLEAIRDWGERMSAACARKAAQETDPVRDQLPPSMMPARRLGLCASSWLWKGRGRPSPGDGSTSICIRTTKRTSKRAS